MDNKRPSDAWCPAAIWVLLAAVSVLSGCAGVLPLPSPSSKYGERVIAGQTRFIQPGKTVREEVLAHLGTDYTTLPRQRAIAYSWEATGITLNWTAFAVGLYGGISEERGDTPVVGGWQAFLVAFDERGVVRAKAFKHLSEQASLHEHLERWCARLPAQAAPDP